MQKRRYHDFPLKFFCLTVPKHFVEEAFCLSDKFWYRKILRIKKGGVSSFSIKCFFFWSQSIKKFRKGRLCFRNFPVSEFFLHRRLYHDFVENFSSLRPEMPRMRIPSVFQKIFGIDSVFA